MSWICLSCARSGGRVAFCTDCERSQVLTVRQRAEAAVRSLTKHVISQDRDRYLLERPRMESLGVQA